MYIHQWLGIRYPLIQGGMAWVSEAKLAAAVSNAGALGVIAAGNAPGDWLEDQIKKTKKLTDKPFGVNVMLLSPYADEAAEIVRQQKVSVVLTGAGNPGKYIEGWKAAGIKVIPVVASLSHAIRMERSGADAVVAEGSESGGHIGSMTTMVLLPEIAENLKIPVIVAGGICDARTAAAAFCLGAAGVQVGTRFVLSPECTVHENYKQKIVDARDIDVEVTGRVTGHPVQALRSPLLRRVKAMEYEPDAAQRIDREASGSLMKAAVHGDREEGTFMAGQCACRMDSVLPVKEIIENIFDKNILNECIERAKGGFDV